MEEYERMLSLRSGPLPEVLHVCPLKPSLDIGEPFTYDSSSKMDNRSSFGKALADVGVRNKGVCGRTPILAFDCDLMGSVKLDGFAKACPEGFIQAGIQEHNTATVAGAASVAGVVSVWADFGVFGLDEVYNQQRLNDINGSSLKLFLTHVGLDVGEDGKTHQCVDYVGLFANTFGWKVVVPADPNQTDRAVRWALSQEGNVCVAMGRSVLPVLTYPDGNPIFAGDYSFRYGAVDVVRDGVHGTILALGPMVGRALKGAEILADRGIQVRVLCTASPLGMSADELFDLVGKGPLLTVEDHNVNTGLGAVVANLMARSGVSIPFMPIGVSRYGDSGASDDVYRRMGLDPEGIAKSFLRLKERNDA
ncbi:transketolase, alpha subunit [Thermanaerovibrio velox DSM 12556]|uniref:Transketolase, alpha subunit n=2 Tax=Thermanaerovibrio TaxID=81461 RepID=H0UQW6_9BACT|nr:transketolase, alpha subunit [Thermanaerovibrio velox DSM 12556]